MALAATRLCGAKRAYGASQVLPSQHGITFMWQCAHCPWPWTHTIFSGCPQDGHCGCKIGFGLASAESGDCCFIWGWFIWDKSVIRLLVGVAMLSQMIPQNANRCKTEPSQTAPALPKPRQIAAWSTRDKAHQKHDPEWWKKLWHPVGNPTYYWKPLIIR